MYKLVVLACLLAVGLAIPPKVRDDNDPNCGLKKARLASKLKSPFITATDWGCELCLDITLIIEMYADCGEAFLDLKFDEDCDKQFGDGTAGDKMCRQMCDEIYEEMRKDTDQDATDVCTRLLKPSSGKCSYN